MNMNSVLTTIAMTSAVLLVGCNKTEKATMVSDPEPGVMTEMDVEVFVDGDAMTITMNGEELDGLPNDMIGHVLHMIGGDEGKHQMQKMYLMGGGEQGDPNLLYGEFRSEPPHQRHNEERHNRDRDVPEEMQFMQELGMLGNIAEQLDDSDAVSLMGIHMIRDELEGEVRMSALETIIEEAGSIARNAALLVAIESMLEEGDDEAAAEYMVELVLSN